MTSSEIKKIEKIGNVIGRKEKPAVLQKDLLFVAGFLKSKGYDVRVSDGLLDKNAFLTPCIMMEHKKESALDPESLIDKFNRTRREIKKNEKFSILLFKNKEQRLDFGNQINQNLVKSVNKMPFLEKKKMMKGFINEFKELKKYLIKNF